jgi:hypothetical protein
VNAMKNKISYHEFGSDSRKRIAYKNYMLKRIARNGYDPMLSFIGNEGEIVNVYVDDKCLAVINEKSEVRCIPWDKIEKIPEHAREDFTICNGMIEFHEFDEQLDWEHIGYMLYPEMKEKAAQYFKEKMGE